jgi:hypothetical protein
MRRSRQSGLDIASQSFRFMVDGAGHGYPPPTSAAQMTVKGVTVSADGNRSRPVRMSNEARVTSKAGYLPADASC